MKNCVTTLLLTCCFVFGPGLGMSDAIAEQPSRISSAKQMNLTGEIAMAAHGYIIRGKSPSEIFTILNPNAEVLDKIIEKGKVVELKVRIVSGDNVDILEIDGKNYDGTGQSGQSTELNQMTLPGKIALASHGYIIRGKGPSEVFTILNPKAMVLDKFIERDKVVELKIQIVSGDNVNILEIDGENYLK